MAQYENSKFTWDHIHLRTTNPEAMAQWFEAMLGAQVLRSMQEGKPRIDVKLGGAKIFIAPVADGDGISSPPKIPYRGLDHFGLSVNNIDAIAADLKKPRVSNSPGADDHPAGRAHLLHSRARGRVDRAARPQHKVRPLDCWFEHDLIRKPVSTPDQVRGMLFRDHALIHHHRRGDLHAAGQIDNVVVDEADAAEGHGIADCLRRVGAVDPRRAGVELKQPRAERIARSARHGDRIAVEQARRWLP